MGFHIGQRLSVKGQRCTVKYMGDVDSFEGDWLGVEWDDASRGKNDGSYNEHQYFTCQSLLPIAGSFIRPTIRFDACLTFHDAFHQRYAEPVADSRTEQANINISGKTVEEYGFEKLNRQLSNLSALKIVDLSDLRIDVLTHERERPDAVAKSSSQFHWLNSLQIVDLRLNDNLIEDWADVWRLYCALPCLKKLSISGNRFRNLSSEVAVMKKDTSCVLSEVELDSVALDWYDLMHLTDRMPDLRNLSVKSNCISKCLAPAPMRHLTHLDLAYNRISSLEDLHGLVSLPDLRHLGLRGNTITLMSQNQLCLSSVSNLDLAYNPVVDLPSLNQLSKSFPSILSLGLQGTPVSKLPSSRLLTTARIGSLQELNYSTITLEERRNAELYYMTKITEQLSGSEVDIQQNVLRLHPRWPILCEKYGKPDLLAKLPTNRTFNSNMLAARIARFDFYLREVKDAGGMSSSGARTLENTEGKMASQKAHSKLLPLSTSLYRLIGIGALMFHLKTIDVRLILETDEFDPVIGDDDGWSMSEDEADISNPNNDNDRSENDKWIRREIELIGSPRSISDQLPNGFGGPDAEVRIRVERCSPRNCIAKK